MLPLLPHRVFSSLSSQFLSKCSMPEKKINCMHPGLGKVVDGVQLHVVKYRATVLTFVVEPPTNMELKRGDVQFTNRLTQEKSQTIEVPTVYTGEKGIILPESQCLLVGPLVTSLR